MRSRQTCAGAVERESENVEDRRGEGGGFGFPFPGGGVRFPSGGGRAAAAAASALSGFLIILGLMLFFGVDPSVIMQGGGPGGDASDLPRYPPAAVAPRHDQFPRSRGSRARRSQRPQTTSEDDLKRFVSVVLGTTEDVWQETLARYGRRYSDPTLVLFSGGVRSACGTGHGADGPVLLPDR